MKHNKLLLLLTLAPLCITGCNKGYGECEITSHQRMENIPIMDSYNINVATGYYDSSFDEVFSFDLFNDSNEVYVPIEQYIEEVFSKFAHSLDFTLDDVLAVSKEEDKKTVVKNTINGSTVTFDFRNGNVSFDDYAAFRNLDKNQVNGGDYFTSELTTRDWFIDDKDNDLYDYDKGHEFKFNLNNYNKKYYWFEDKGYIPLNICNTIFNMYYNNSSSLYYNGYALFDTKDLSFYEYRRDDVLDYLNTTGKYFDKEYMESNYECFALYLDLHYGIKERSMRTNGKKFVYMPNGAHAMLEKYKEDLLSTEPGVYDIAMKKIFDDELCDGGHTQFVGPSIFIDDDTYSSLSSTTIPQNDYGYTEQAILSLTTARNNTFGNSSVDCISVVDDTLFITFDVFYISSSMGAYSSKYCDVVSLVDLARETLNAQKSKIKNVVVDLSLNTGGEVAAGVYIESWLCGGSFNIKTSNPKSDSYSHISKHADCNHDGKFDENDYLSKDLKLYAIVSPATFSCGNYLACQLKDYTNCKFIGSQSGGGCCCVGTGDLPCGSQLRIGENLMLLRKESKVGHLVSNDDGVTADFYNIPFSMFYANKYYNRTNIVDHIHLDR